MGGLQQLNEHAHHHGVSRPETFVCPVCGLHFHTLDALQQHADYLGHYAAEVLHRPAPGAAASEAVESLATAQQQHEQKPNPRAITPPQEDGSDVLMHDVFETISVEPSTLEPLHSATHHATFSCPECNQTFCSEDAVATHRGRAHYNSPQVHTKGVPWSMHPDLHDEVAQRLDGNGCSVAVEFCEEGQTKASIHHHDTNVTGVFTCPEPSCLTKTWTSSRIGISIRMYERGLYNATVWHQRCRRCEGLGELQLDVEAYTDRVAYRLSKWMGLRVERPPYQRRMLDQPHESTLCEGCKRGHCRIEREIEEYN